ncbi:MAG: tetratricopeptide repeat protein [Planctomycetia bacterium]|nr:tetratricopeptide repeat protein [Planctomycetia bacterium]
MTTRGTTLTSRIGAPVPIMVLLFVSIFGMPSTGAWAADPPTADADLSVYRNELSALGKRHVERFVPFSFKYPKHWKADPKAGTDQSSNFVKFERQAVAADGEVTTLENLAVGALEGIVPGDIGRELMKALTEQFRGQFANGFPNFKAEPDRDLKFGTYAGFGFDFSFQTDDKSVGGWGRIVLLPAYVVEQPRGMLIVMIATTAAPELKTAADLGVKGELPTLIASFKAGNAPLAGDDASTQVKKLIEQTEIILARKTLNQAKDLDAALALIDEAIRLAPKNPRALVVRSELRVARGEYPQVIVDLDAAVAAAPENVQSRLVRGRYLLRINKAKEAAADFEEAIRLAPDAAEGYSARAKLHLDESRIDASLKDYDTAIRLDSKNLQTYLGRAAARYQKVNYGSKDFTLVLADYDAAIGLDPKSTDALESRAQLYEQIGKLPEAVRDYDALLLLQPNYYRKREQRALLLVRIGDYDRALTEITELLKSDTRDALYAHLYKARGDAYCGKKDYEKGIADFDEAAKRAPRFQFLRMERPEAWVPAEQLTAALADADAAIKAAPKELAEFERRANYRYLKKDYAGAIADFDVAFGTEPTQSFLVAARGFAKLHLLRDREARDDFDLAVKLFEAEPKSERFPEKDDFRAFLDQATVDIEARRKKPAPEKP